MTSTLSTRDAPSALDAISHWQQSGDYFDFEGHQIFYRDSGGDGKAVLLLLHGFPTSSWDWRELWPSLADKFRVICFDFIGFGLSDKPKLPRYLIHMQADIAEQLLQHVGVIEYNILAHDYGDTVAQEILARELENASGLVKSCIFLNGGLFPEVHKPLLMQRLLLSPLGGIISRLASFRKFVSSFDRICGQSLDAADLRVHWELLVRSHGRSVIPKIVGYMDQRVRYRERWVGALTKGTLPMCLINGLADPISGGHMADRYEELVPNANIVGLPAVGHYPQNENAAGVLDAAEAFWSKHNVYV